MILAADEVMVYDNYFENCDPTLLFQKFFFNENDPDPQMIIWESDDEKIIAWVIERIIYPLRSLGYSVACYKVV